MCVPSQFESRRPRRLFESTLEVTSHDEGVTDAD